MEDVFAQNQMETEIIQIGGKLISGCMGCQRCYKTGSCAIEDEVNETAEKFKNADGLVIASPVYYASANGSLIAFLDRLFYSSKFSKTMKVGAAVAVARRAGTTATFDQLNKYFGISGMPVAGSRYWNIAHGAVPGEIEKDIEGLQTLRFLAENMTFLMKSIELGKEKYGIPVLEKAAFTNFIR